MCWSIASIDIELMSVSESQNAEKKLVNEIEEINNLRAELQKVVFQIDDYINSALTPQPMTPPATLNMMTHGGTFTQNECMKSIRAKLPKLTVKRFDGKIQEWQEFGDSFDSSVNWNDCLSDVDKFAYLKGFLTEPARSTIAGFLLTATNYKDALDLLKNRYDTKNIIQRAQMQELVNQWRNGLWSVLEQLLWAPDF